MLGLGLGLGLGLRVRVTDRDRVRARGNRSGVGSTARELLLLEGGGELVGRVDLVGTGVRVSLEIE